MRKTLRDHLFGVQEYFATLFVSRLRRRVFAGIAAVSILAAVLVFSNKGLLRRVQLTAERQRLEAELVTMQRQQDSLRTVKALLQTDAFTIERVAREQYGLTRPGETVYRREPRAEGQ